MSPQYLITQDMTSWIFCANRWWQNNSKRVQTRHYAPYMHQCGSMILRTITTRKLATSLTLTNGIDVW